MPPPCGTDIAASTAQGLARTWLVRQPTTWSSPAVWMSCWSCSASRSSGLGALLHLITPVLAPVLHKRSRKSCRCHPDTVPPVPPVPRHCLFVIDRTRRALGCLGGRLPLRNWFQYRRIRTRALAVLAHPAGRIGHTAMSPPLSRHTDHDQPVRLLGACAHNSPYPCCPGFWGQALDTPHTMIISSWHMSVTPKGRFWGAFSTPRTAALPNRYRKVGDGSF